MLSAEIDVNLCRGPRTATKVDEELRNFDKDRIDLQTLEVTTEENHGRTSWKRGEEVRTKEMCRTEMFEARSSVDTRCTVSGVQCMWRADKGERLQILKRETIQSKLI